MLLVARVALLLNMRGRCVISPLVTLVVMLLTLNGVLDLRLTCVRKIIRRSRLFSLLTSVLWLLVLTVLTALQALLIRHRIRSLRARLVLYGYFFGECS